MAVRAQTVGLAEMISGGVLALPPELPQRPKPKRLKAHRAPQ